MAAQLQNFLDEEGRVKQWPAKHALKREVVAYLAEKFDAGVDYTEHEVNAIVAQWHTFGDYFLLRRALVEDGWLCRLRDGSRYWKNPDKLSGQEASGAEA